MNDSDKNLNIAINLATQKSGPDAVKEIAKVTDAAKESGKASVKAADESREATNKWKAGVRGLALQYPLLGRLAAMALNPITIGVAAITAAISRANQITHTWGEQLKTSAAAAAIPISNLTQQFREMESERTKANTAFQTSLQNIQTFADHAIAKMEAIRTATEKAIDAQEKFELATEKDPARQAELRFAFAARRSMNSEAAEAAIQQRREQQLQKLDTQAAKQRDLAAGLAQGRSREAIEAELRDGGAGLAARIAAEEKQIAELRAAVIDSHAVPGTFGKVNLLPKSLRDIITTGSAAEIQSARNTATSLMPGGNAQVESLVSALLALQQTQGAQKDFAARKPRLEMAVAAYSAMETAITRRDTLEGEIVRSRDITRATAPFRTEAAVLDSATAAAGRGQGGAARMVLSAAAGADAVLAGGKANADQAAAINQLVNAFGLHGQNQQTILEILSKFNDREKYFENALATLESRVNVHRQLQ